MSIRFTPLACVAIGSLLLSGFACTVGGPDVQTINGPPSDAAVPEDDGSVSSKPTEAGLPGADGGSNSNGGCTVCPKGCFNLDNDPNNCGSCGRKCTGGPCTAGKCFTDPSCETAMGYTMCRVRCFDSAGTNFCTSGSCDDVCTGRGETCTDAYATAGDGAVACNTLNCNAPFGFALPGCPSMAYACLCKQ